MQVVIRDISERKKADEAIAALNQDRKIILDTMPAMIWYKDTRNNFIRVNAAVATNTGIPAESFEGKNASELFPEESGQYYRDDLDVIRSGAPRYGIVEQLTVAGGGKIWSRPIKSPFVTIRDRSPGSSYSVSTSPNANGPKRNLPTGTPIFTLHTRTSLLPRKNCGSMSTSSPGASMNCGRTRSSSGLPSRKRCSSPRSTTGSRIT